MKNKRNIICILLSIIFIAGFIYTNNKIGKSNDNTIKNTASASWHDGYENLNDMIEAADIIIQGKQIDSYTELISDNLIITKEIIEVKKVYQGDVVEGDKIEVLQTGGEMNNISTAPIEDAPLMDKNGNYLLLLRKSTDGRGNYLILGGYQGIGKIQKNGNLKFNNENDGIALKFKDKDFTEFEEILLKNINK